jgi:UDP-glucose 4-epimerase
MKALVTGGAGFIGSHVVRQGMEAGWDITVLDDFSTGQEGNLPHDARLRVVRGDIREAAVLDEAMAGADVVFHLAASVGNIRSIEAPLHDAEVNVLGTLEVLEAMRRTGVRRIVYSSSAAIFGEPRSLPIDEDHPTEPDSPYGVTKLAAEKHCLCYGRIHGLRVTCLRYFNVYGSHQLNDAYGNVIPIFAGRLLRGEPLVIYGDGEQTRDFVNVEDVARANWLAVKHDATGVFNIGSGVATRVADLAAMIQECAGRVVTVQRVAPRPGEVRHSVARVDRGAALLDYTPSVPLRRGLKDYVCWSSEA